MRRWVSLLMMATVALLALTPPASGSQTPERSTAPPINREVGNASYVPGELLVTYKEGADQNGATERTVQQAEAIVEKELPGLRAQLLSFPEVKAAPSLEVREEELERVKQALEQDLNVEAVGYNYLRRAQDIPDDPRFDEQYGLKKPGFPKAWERALGEGVRIAVVDSGIDSAHPDIGDKVVAQRDFVDDDEVAQDDTGHGTHVAGIAAATTGNGEGVAGGCPRCTLLVARVFEKDEVATVANEIEGIIWATDNGAQVINLSLGGFYSSPQEEAAVDYAWGKGAVVVAAAGNYDSSEPFYPAAYPNALAVAATNSKDRRFFSWNVGKYVDLAAPGIRVLSTVPGGYGEKSGTSMASPHVAALAALLAERGLSNQEIRTRMTKTAKDLGPEGRDRYYGAGRINAARAVG